MDWKQLATWLIRRVAPEFQQPIYLLTADEAAAVDKRLLLKHHAGWTSFLNDLLFSNYLYERDQWQGRGFCCVIDTEQLTTLHDRIGGVLHEFGHCLTFPEVTDSDDTIDLPLGRVALKVIPEKWSQPPKPVEPPPPWHHHEADFIRCCVHLAHRAGQELECIRPSHLLFSEPYVGLSENTFVTALHCELHDRRPIRDILQDDAPPSFTKLWELATDGN